MFPAAADLAISCFDLQSFTLVGPELDKLACIPENRNLTEYYSAVDYELMITVYAR